MQTFGSITVLVAFQAAAFCAPLPQSGSPAAARPEIPLREQLGLKLEPKKAPGEVLIVDHVEKTPTGN